MSQTTRNITRTLTPALAVAAVMAPGAAAYQDLRSPDSRDAAADSAATVSRDGRSPDVVLASRPSEARGHQDLRSPDARDAGRAISTVSPPPTAASGSSGSDWHTAGIVAGGLLSLMIVLGSLILFTRRRNALRKRRTPAVSS